MVDVAVLKFSYKMSVCEECEIERAQLSCQQCEQKLCQSCELNLHLRGARRLHTRTQLVEVDGVKENIEQIIQNSLQV